MKSVLIITLIGFFSAGMLLQLQQITAGESNDAKSLFEKKCSACHSLGKVKSKKKSSEGWAKVVNKMKGRAEKNEKTRISNDEEKIIADYLSIEYGE